MLMEHQTTKSEQILGAICLRGNYVDDKSYERHFS